MLLFRAYNYCYYFTYTIDDLTKYIQGKENKSKSAVILKHNGPAAQDMIVLMRRLFYLSFSSLPTV